MGPSPRGSFIRPTAAVLPDGSSHLSDGVVIETRLKARLLGAPVLRLDGTVVVSPGRLVELDRAARGATSRQAPSVGAPGRGLARAAQLIADTDGSIDRWHRR